MDTIPAPHLPFYPPLVPGQPVPVPSPEQRAMDRVFYPESDGERIAENTEQFQWIELIKGGLDSLFADNPAVFVAADLLWYPQETQRNIRVAPDVLVAFGRPKGHRGLYLQWREENIPPQVVFEVLSPGNTPEEMADKLLFYQRFGVEEYYTYSPRSRALQAYLRRDGLLAEVDVQEDHVSPRLGIRFDRETDGTLRLVRPDGRPLVGYVELDRQREAAERQLLIAEEQREAAEERASRMAERLRALGLDPDTL